jgi:transposase
MTPDEEIELQVVTLSQRGWGQRRIAKEVGLGRKSVRTIVERISEQREQGHTALPAAPERRPSQLDSFVPQMLTLLHDHPDITAVRMREELERVGYRGGYSILKERMRELRPTPKAPFVERFETEPGAQGQQDWSPYTIPFTASGERKTHCFSLVLGFSRRQYIGFTEREDLLTFERQHIHAFKRFKGAPREILYDNQKVVVLRREAHRPVYNPKFLAFATHYGFVPRVLAPGKPEHKGKVERPFQYVEGNCLNARTFRDQAELDEHAMRWMDETSDVHLHDTTRERPIDRFEREQEHLLPLPKHPYDTAEVGYRVVSREALVRWEDVPYSVPIGSLLDVVVVRATEREVIIYANDLTELARHERAPRGHREPVITAAHRPSRAARQDVEALAAKMGEMGDAAARFAAGVLSTQRYRGTHLEQVLSQIERYTADDVVRALERAVRYRAYDGGVVVRILEATATPRQLPSMEQESVRTRLAEQGAALAVPPRSMSDYAAVFAPDEPDEPRDPEEET